MDNIETWGCNGRPCCPNHGCEMDSSGNPSIWICPISNARFEVSCATEGVQYRKTANGELQRRYVIAVNGENDTK